MAAAAMLDLGICSGSLRCVLLTAESIISNGAPNGASAIDSARIAGSVTRLWDCAAVGSSTLPVGGRTYFLPTLLLELQASSPGLVGAGGPGSGGASLTGSLRPSGSLGRTQLSLKPHSALSPARFVSVATDGSYLYLHTSSGLAKLGTGYNGTFEGYLYASKSGYRALEKPWMAVAGGKIYLRSPAMAPHCLTVVDCDTLEEVGAVKQGEGGAGGNLLPEQTVAGGGGGGGGGGGDGGAGSGRGDGGGRGGADGILSDMELLRREESELRNWSLPRAVLRVRSAGGEDLPLESSISNDVGDGDGDSEMPDLFRFTPSAVCRLPSAAYPPPPALCPVLCSQRPEHPTRNANRFCPPILLLCRISCGHNLTPHRFSQGWARRASPPAILLR